MDTPKDTQPQHETVTVNKEALDKLIKRVEDQDARIALLTEAADKKRLDLVQRRHQAPMPKIVHVHKFQGKYVQSTVLTSNEAYHDPTGRYVEKQELEVKFFGGDETLTVPLRQYGIQHEKIPADVVSSTTDSQGVTTFTVKVKDSGETLTVDSRFIN